jgi:predicted membrane metal-binding protein
VKTRSWNPVIILGIVLGASLGAVAALVLLRRSRRGAELGLRDIPWREMVTLLGPIVALSRRLIEMSRRELAERDLR